MIEDWSISSINVDGLRHMCPNGTYETFTDHLFDSMTITCKDRPNASGDTAPPAIIIEYYTIEYRRSESDPTPAPVLPTRKIYENYYLPGGGDLKISGLYLVDIQTKTVFENFYANRFDVDNTNPDGLNEEFIMDLDDPIRYIALYTFYGQTVYGEPISFTFMITFTMSDFETC